MNHGCELDLTPYQHPFETSLDTRVYLTLLDKPSLIGKELWVTPSFENISTILLLLSHYYYFIPKTL